MSATGADPDRVSVAIVEAAAEAGRWTLAYEVRNQSGADVWRVDDGELAFRREDGRIELSYAREALRPETSAFGYFVPRTRRLAAGEAERVAVELDWPLRLSGLWNAEPRADLPPGRYEVSVAVGIAASPEPREPRLGEPVEAPVLEWQTKIVSKPRTVDHS